MRRMIETVVVVVVVVVRKKPPPKITEPSSFRAAIL